MTSDQRHNETYSTQINYSVKASVLSTQTKVAVQHPLPQLSYQRSLKIPRKGKLYNIYNCQDEEQVHQKIKHQQKLNNPRPQLGVITQSDLSIKLSSRDSRPDSNRAKQNEHFIFVGSAFNIPKNQNSPSEDAFFCHEKGVGVSDGVGGWNSYGIDCSLFSNNLMRECQKFISRVSVRTKQYFIDPKVTIQEMECHRQALETSMESFNSSNISSQSSEFSLLGQNSTLEHQKTYSQGSLFGNQAKHLCPQTILKFCLRRTNFPGSATATICVLNNKDLTALNLGDSGFIVFRFDSNNHDPYILIKSNEQLHGFNTPFQLTKLPTQREVEQLRSQQKKKELQNLKRALKEKRFCNDAPEDSDIYQVCVREGDLLLLATDGVFDNLFVEEIQGIVRNLTSRDNKTKHNAHLIAKTVSEAAYQRSKRNHVKTPFSMKKAHYIIQQKNKARQGLMSPQESKQMKQFAKESGLDEDSILVDNEFEDMCIGKGKADDITTAAFWIKQNKSIRTKRR